MSYSFIRHFVRAIHQSPQRDAQVAMYSAYFDASGTKRTPVLTLGGFVSTVNKWERFEKEWARILKANGVSFFHMTEFASSKGEFADWKGDSERRKKFIDELIGCINLNTNKGFAASVVIADYDRVNSKHTLTESIGHPLAICGGVCIGAMRKWANHSTS